MHPPTQRLVYLAPCSGGVFLAFDAESHLVICCLERLKALHLESGLPPPICIYKRANQLLKEPRCTNQKMLGV